MSKFLDELRRYINASVQTGVYKDEYDVNLECKDEALNMIDSLGENARRMLEIGIVQDELVKLGFKPRDTKYLTKWALFEQGKFRIGLCYGVVFSHTSAGIMENTTTTYFNYDSPTFREDVINKVKELIND